MGPIDTEERWRAQDTRRVLKRWKGPTLGRARQSPKEVARNGTARACKHSRTGAGNRAHIRTMRKQMVGYDVCAYEGVTWGPVNTRGRWRA